MKKALFGLILLFASTLSAQHCTVEGHVRDSLTQKPIQYAFVRLFSADNQLIEGTMTDTNGRFVFQKVPKREYNLSIDCFGYHSQKIRLLISTQKMPDNRILLSDINLMQDSKLLQAVEIKADAKIQQTVDKTVYSIDSSFLANATNALDVAQHIPEISVDHVNNSISLKGYGGCLIMINGIYKENEVVDMRSLNPEDIEKIEIITNPASDIPSEYEGVINIVLKQQLKTSWFLNTEVGWRPWLKALDPYVMFGYSKNKVRVGVNYFYMLRRHTLETDVERLQNDSSAVYRSHSEKVRPFLENGHVVKAYLDYYITPKSYLHFSTQQSLSDRKEHWEEVTTNATPLAFDSLFMTTYSKQFYYVGDYTAYFRQSFKTTEQALSVSANAQYMNADYFNDYSLFNYSEADSSWQSREKGIRSAYNLKIDYTHPFANNSSLTVGGYGFYQHFKSAYDTDEGEESSLYQDVKANLYADYRFKIKKVDFRIGFKTDYYHAWQDTLKGHYFTYLPTLVISRRFSNKHQVRFNYRATSLYPSLWALRPYEVKIDNWDYSVGNPSLKPQVDHRVDLAYTYRTRPFMANVRLYANKTLNSISTVAQLSPDNVKHTTVQNVDGRFRTGVNGFFTLSLFEEMWEISPSFNMYWERFNLRNNFSGGAELETYLFLPYGIQIFAAGGYTGKILVYQGYIEPRWSISRVGIIKRFLDGNLSVMLAYWEPFHHPKDIIVLEFEAATERTVSRINTNTFVLRITYNFSKGKQIDTRNQINEEIGKDLKN